jgi:hypothetical protein
MGDQYRKSMVLKEVSQSLRLKLRARAEMSFPPGFIGLVVGLGLLIIGCSVAVFVLLRRKSYQGSSSSSGRGLPFPLPFGKHQHDPSSGSGFPAQGSSFGRGNKGWVRTEGEDAWDDEGGVGLVNRSELRSPNPDVPQHPYPSHPDRSASVESASTVRLSAPGAGQYGDAFSTSPSTDSFHDHDEQTSRHEYAPVDTSHDLPRTPTSPTFEGGTRFKEDLP